MLKAFKKAKRKRSGGSEGAASNLLETQTAALLPGLLKKAKEGMAELGPRSSGSQAEFVPAAAESFDALFSGYGAESASASISSDGDAMILDSFKTYNKQEQEEQELRKRIAVDIFGPGIAAMMEQQEAHQQQQQQQQQQEEDGQAFSTSAATNTSSSSPSSPSLLSSSPLFMEMTTNLMARGVPGLSLILKPVVNGVMKPVLKVAINMMTPSLTEIINENLQARMVAQLPADVAKKVSNKGGPALATALTDALSATLAKSVSAAITKTLGLKLRDSIPDAVSPRVVTAVVRKVTDTVVYRLVPQLVKATKGLVAKNLASILMRSVSHAVTSTLSMTLNPLRFPPKSLEEGMLRKVQCEVCEAIRSGSTSSSSSSPFGPTLSKQAILMLARMGLSPEQAGLSPSSLPSSSSIACYLCEKGTAQERVLDEFVTQQAAHYYADYYSRYNSAYYNQAMKQVQEKRDKLKD